MTQSFIGRAAFWQDQPSPIDGWPALFVTVACEVEGQRLDALLDTAAQWSLLPLTVAAALSCVSSDEALEELIMGTRLGRIRGHLWRLGTRLLADEGEALDIEAVWFVSSDWPGPAVLGWKGFLEHVSFALNPGQGPDEAWFYFAHPISE